MILEIATEMAMEMSTIIIKVMAIATSMEKETALAITMATETTIAMAMKMATTMAMTIKTSIPTLTMVVVDKQYSVMIPQIPMGLHTARHMARQ